MVLRPTVESQILYSPFHMIGSFMVFSLIVDFFVCVCVILIPVRRNITLTVLFIESLY